MATFRLSVLDALNTFTGETLTDASSSVNTHFDVVVTAKTTNDFFIKTVDNSGTAITGVTITIDGSGAGTTDANGYLHLNKATATYSISASKTNYDTISGDIAHTDTEITGTYIKMYPYTFNRIVIKPADNTLTKIYEGQTGENTAVVIDRSAMGTSSITMTDGTTGKTEQELFDDMVAAFSGSNTTDKIVYKPGSEVTKRAYSDSVSLNGVLDDYTGVSSAWSLRRLKASYSGSAIRVRRSSDNTEQDIGFNSVTGGLDTSSLTTFVGSNNGFVVKWYDQSGNSKDLTERTNSATYQPKIVDSGSVITEGSKPAIRFDVVGHNLQNQSLGWSVTSQSVFQVVTFSNVSLSNSNHYMRTISLVGTSGTDWQLANNWIPPHRQANTSGIDIYGVTGADIVRTTMNWNTQMVLSSIHTGSNIYGFKANSAFTTNQGPLNTLNTTHAKIALGMQANQANVTWGDSHFKGTMQEIIIYNSDKTSDKTSIYNNLDGFYNISEENPTPSVPKIADGKRKFTSDTRATRSTSANYRGRNRTEKQIVDNFHETFTNSVSWVDTGAQFTTDGLAALWDFKSANVTKDGSNLVSSVTDTSDNSNAVTQSTGSAKPTWNSGNGGHLTFDNNQDFLEVAHTTDHTFTDGFSYGVWFKWDGQSQNGAFISKRNDFPYDQYAMGVSANQHTGGNGYNVGGHIRPSSGQGYSTAGMGSNFQYSLRYASINRWYYAVITIDGTNDVAKIWINGLYKYRDDADASSWNSTSVFGPAKKLGIGGSTFSNNITPSNALPIAKVHIHDKVLSATEIKDNFLADAERFGHITEIPTDNLFARYVASEGVTKNGSNQVTGWADQSSNGNDLSTTTSLAPVYTTGGFNSQPYLKFNADAVLTGATAADLHTDGGTVIYVWHLDYTGNGAANYDYPFSNFKSSDGKGLSFGTNGATTTNFNVFVHTNGANAYRNGQEIGTGSNYGFGNNTPQMLCLTVTGSTVRKQYCFNNTTNNYGEGHNTNGLHTYITPNQSYTRTVPSDEFRIGSASANADRAFSGRIYEILIYEKALTDAEVNNIRTYLDFTYNCLGWTNRAENAI